MFAGKAGAYPRVQHLERLARDKHSIVLRKSVNYGRKKFYSTVTKEKNLKTLTPGVGVSRAVSVLKHYHQDIDETLEAKGFNKGFMLCFGKKNLSVHFIKFKLYIRRS
jgi:hypothetical protein